MFLESKGIFWKLLDDKDPMFVNMKYTLDNTMKEGAATGLGSVVKHAKILSFNDEDLMWKSGVLGTDNPQQLLDTLLFLLSIHYALHAGQEHRNLRSIGFQSQFSYTFIDGVRHVVYKEDLGTKTNQGGLKHKKIETKEVIIFPNKSNCERCPVAAFYHYHCKLPPTWKTKALYLKPWKKFTPNDCTVIEPLV